MSNPYVPLTLPDIGTGSIAMNWFDDLETPRSPLTPRTPRTPRTPQTPPLRSRAFADDLSTDEFHSALATPTSSLLAQLLNANSPPPPIPPKSPERRSSPGSLAFLQHAKKPRIPSTFADSYKIHELMMDTPDMMLLPEQTQPINPLDRWITCALVVRFDVDIGPDLKIIQPAIQLSEEDYRIICFSALPERSSNRETQGQFHTFRFESTTFPGVELHGFALFSQQKMPSSARGYIQESLVIISKLNYPQVFNACLQLMVDGTDNTLDHGLPSPISPTSPNSNRSIDNKAPVILAAVNDIALWPSPEPNSTLEVTFLGTIINISIPLHESMPLLGTVDLDASSVNFHSMGRKSISTRPLSASPISLSFDLVPRDAPVITASEPAASWDYLIDYISDVSDLYILYEYMLLAKPIVVYASFPHQCSTFISLLVDLIRPIPYAGRIREYVTMHTCPSQGGLDAEGGIVGVTNPFLVRDVRDDQTLVFVLSPPSNTSQAIASPFRYYKTYHNGVNILRRDATVPRDRSHAALVPVSPPSSKAYKDYGPPQQTWKSRLFKRRESKVEKARISSPLIATFVRLPNNLTPISPDVILAAGPISPGPESAGSQKNKTSGGGDWESDQVNRDEEAKIKNSMRISKRNIIKNRLLFPDQKFLASLNRMIYANANGSELSRRKSQDGSGSASIGGAKSIDLAIRFHFATLTSRFLSPLGCYLDPKPSLVSRRKDHQQQQQLEFSQTEFMNDLVSTTYAVLPRRKASLRALRPQSMIVSSNSGSNPSWSVSAMSSDYEGSSTTLYPISSNENSNGNRNGNARSNNDTFNENGSTTTNDSKRSMSVRLRRNGSKRSLGYGTRGNMSATSLMVPGTVGSSTNLPLSSPAALSLGLAPAPEVKLQVPTPTTSPAIATAIATAPATVSATDKKNRRSSMLALSSLGIKFSASASASSTMSGPLSSPPLSPRIGGTSNGNGFGNSGVGESAAASGGGGGGTRSSRASKRISGLFSSSDETSNTSAGDSGSCLNDGLAGGAGSNSTTTTTTTTTSTEGNARHQEQANLHKQAIYKMFLGTPNFKSWLSMNDVSIERGD